MVEISFQDEKVGESINENSIYAKVKEAVQEFHGDYGVACLARYLKGTSFPCQSDILKGSNDKKQ